MGERVSAEIGQSAASVQSVQSGDIGRDEKSGSAVFEQPLDSNILEALSPARRSPQAQRLLVYEAAPDNICIVLTTLVTFQLQRSAPKLLAPWNMPLALVSFSTFHVDRSALKFDALANMLCMSTTLDVSHIPRS